MSDDLHDRVKKGMYDFDIMRLDTSMLTDGQIMKLNEELMDENQEQDAIFRLLTHYTCRVDELGPKDIQITVFGRRLPREVPRVTDI